MKTFDVIRINKLENTITVLLKCGERTLQQDVVVKNFTDMDHIKEEIQKHLDKFEMDLARVFNDEEQEVHEDLQAMVDKYTKSFTNEPN